MGGIYDVISRLARSAWIAVCVFLHIPFSVLDCAATRVMVTSRSSGFPPPATTVRLGG